MAARTLCCVNHFLVRRIRLSKANVIGNRVVEQIDVLEHNTDVFQHLIGIILTNILAADGNRTAVHIPESANQIAQGSFAAAGISDNRRRGLLRNGQRHMVDDIFLLIGETNIVHCNIAVFTGKRLAAVFQLRRISALLNFTQCRVYILQNCNHAACQLELVEDDKQPNDCQSRFFDSNLSIEPHHHRNIHRQYRAALQNNLRNHGVRHDLFLIRCLCRAAFIEYLLHTHFGAIIVVLKRANDDNALNVFQYALNELGHSLLLARGFVLRRAEHALHNDTVKHGRNHHNQTDFPLKAQKSDEKNRCVQNALQDIA